MGRILFVSFYDFIRPDFFFLSLSLGNHGPLVRRKDLGKFRHSLPQEPAVYKTLFVLLPCISCQCPGWWLLKVTDHHRDSLSSSRDQEARL